MQCCSFLGIAVQEVQKELLVVVIFEGKTKLEELNWLSLLKKRMRRDMVAIFAEACILEGGTLKCLVQSPLDN